MGVECTDEGELEGFHEGIPQGFLVCIPARSRLTCIVYAHELHSRESMAVLTCGTSQTGGDLQHVSDREQEHLMTLLI